MAFPKCQQNNDSRFFLVIRRQSEIAGLQIVEERLRLISRIVEDGRRGLVSVRDVPGQLHGGKPAVSGGHVIQSRVPLCFHRYSLGRCEIFRFKYLAQIGQPVRAQEATSFLHHAAGRRVNQMLALVAG